AIEHAVVMARDGADIIDIGAESTRPGAAELSEAEELNRILPVVEGICKLVATPISVDTYKSGVARRGVTAGASMVNDVSALRFDSQMGNVVAELGVPI